MAEEETTAAPAKEETATNGDAKPKRDYKKEQKPIEELYDLSKPIPRVSAVKNGLRESHVAVVLGGTLSTDGMREYVSSGNRWFR